MTFVETVAAHAQAMALIQAAAFPLPECWDPDEIAAQVSLPGTCGLICLLPVPSGRQEPGGGFILFRMAADEAEVLTLAVSPACRRRGLGRRLLQAALDRAQARGAVNMFLEVAADNIPASSLYVSAGFTQVGRRPGYYPGGGDALVLRRALIPGGAAGDVIRPAGASVTGPDVPAQQR